MSGCLLRRSQLGAIAGIINLCVQGQGGDIVMRILRYALRKAVLSSAHADQQQGMFHGWMLVCVSAAAGSFSSGTTSLADTRSSHCSQMHRPAW